MKSQTKSGVPTGGPWARRQSGQAIVEYILIGVMVVAFLFIIPVPWDSANPKRTAFAMLIDGFKKNYRAYEWAMSLPD